MGTKFGLPVTGFLVFISLVSTLWTVGSDASTPKSAERACSLSSLTVTQKPNAGLGHEWIVLVFHNPGDSRCAMSGYPTVSASLRSGPFSNENGPARRSKPGTVVRAIDRINTYGGGVTVAGNAGKRLARRGLILKPVVGTASVVIGWSGEDGSKACPWFRSFTLGWKGTKQYLRTGPSPLCGPIDVTPIVPGNTGWLSRET